MMFSSIFGKKRKVDCVLHPLEIAGLVEIEGESVIVTRDATSARFAPKLNDSSAGK